MSEGMGHYQWHERQYGVADFNDLAAVLRDSEKFFTIDKRAVLAALIRIEERLAKIESKGCSCK